MEIFEFIYLFIKNVDLRCTFPFLPVYISSYPPKSLKGDNPELEFNDFALKKIKIFQFGKFGNKHICHTFCQWCKFFPGFKTIVFKIEEGDCFNFLRFDWETGYY